MLHRSVEGAVMWEAGVGDFFSRTAECVIGLQWVWTGTDMQRLGAGGMALRVAVTTQGDNKDEIVIAFQTHAAEGMYNTLPTLPVHHGGACGIAAYLVYCTILEMLTRTLLIQATTPLLTGYGSGSFPVSWIGLILER